MNGIAIDAATDQPLSGVKIQIAGVGEALTGNDGLFHLDAMEPSELRTVTVSSAATVNRVTQVRAPGQPLTLSLIPLTLDLRAFDQMCRGAGAIVRWTFTPPIVVSTRVLQFSGVSDQDYAATGTTMVDSDVSGLLADLTWGLPQLTGGVMGSFGGETREDAAEGARVNVVRAGVILVARVRGLTSGANALGFARLAWNSAGEMQSAVIMLDEEFELSASTFKRSVRVHELGHALGYGHVTFRSSVMNLGARIDPNAFDRDAGKIAYRRPPLNRTPDVDPEPYSVNRVRLSGLTWAGLQ